eukprot:552094-Rhodomonas_salina.1
MRFAVALASQVGWVWELDLGFVVAGDPTLCKRLAAAVLLQREHALGVERPPLDFLLQELGSRTAHTPPSRPAVSVPRNRHHTARQQTHDVEDEEKVCVWGGVCIPAGGTRPGRRADRDSGPCCSGPALAVSSGPTCAHRTAQDQTAAARGEEACDEEARDEEAQREEARGGFAKGQ